MDEFARLNMEEFRRASEAGEEYTVPWLELDVEAFRAYREGNLEPLPGPYRSDPPAARMFERSRGLNVLCLAGGGGQQSAVYGLLGANVTVLDLTLEQLQADRVAAAHYGYAVTTIQGDMRDLSGLPDHHFDRVYQPISTLFIPDLQVVYRGVARVLKPGGLYYADFAVPLLYMAHNQGWDGSGYLLHVHQPYQRGRILEQPGEVLSFTDGQPIGEYHHLLSDIINGLVAEGLAICGVWENPRPDDGIDPAVFRPGSEQHRDRYLPFGLSVLSQKL